MKKNMKIFLQTVSVMAVLAAGSQAALAQTSTSGSAGGKPGASDGATGSGSDTQSGTTGATGATPGTSGSTSSGGDNKIVEAVPLPAGNDPVESGSVAAGKDSLSKPGDMPPPLVSNTPDVPASQGNGHLSPVTGGQTGKYNPDDPSLPANAIKSYMRKH